MTGPLRRGELRGFDPGSYPNDDAPAAGLVILTEDDWNNRMRSVTVAAVFHLDTHPSPGDPTIVDLGQGDYVDCTQIFEALKERVGEPWTPPLVGRRAGRGHRRRALAPLHRPVAAP